MSSASLHSLDPKQLSRLGIDPSRGPRTIHFQAPLLSKMGFATNTQVIIAKQLLDDRYDSIFTQKAQESLYAFVFDQCSADHRILNFIVWDPTIIDQSATCKREKVKELARIICRLTGTIEIPPPSMGPYQFPQARLEKFAPLELGDLGEQAVLYYVERFGRGKIPNYRAINPHFIPSLEVPILDNLEIRILSASGNPMLRDKKQILDMLCRRVLSFGIKNPNVSLDEIPYPQKVPQELSTIPADELYVPHPPNNQNLFAQMQAAFAPIQIPQPNAALTQAEQTAAAARRDKLHARIKEAKKRIDDAIPRRDAVFRANSSATAAATSATATPTEQTATVAQTPTPNTIPSAQTTPIPVPVAPQQTVPSIANLIEPKPNRADILMREAEEQSALVRELEIDEKLRNADAGVQAADEEVRKTGAALQAANEQLRKVQAATAPNPQPPTQPSVQKWVFEFVREYKGSITSVALSSLAALCAFGALAGAVAGVATAVLFASVQWIRKPREAQ